ncbi:MAG: hypothetical protein KF883_08475 [Thermomicrobiales bacterium]|nr:hypothetical protein [Thermomicrobiales bacterium]
MDNKRFDELTKLIGGGGPSRRSVLKGLLGIGGAAATGGLAVEAVDARDARSRPTVPPPPPPACALPKQMCGGVCCDAGMCKDGICCTSTTAVNCGGVCCNSGVCAGSECCDPGEEACGTVCCSPVAPEPYSGQTSACAREGNHDFCCGTGWQCGLDCCNYEHQCCDRECCLDGHACMATVYDSSANYFEEHCCPIPQICGNTCCDGSCYDPGANIFPSLDPTEINAWAACCPAGGNVCTGPLDDPNGVGTVCCEDPTPRCCVREDEPNAGIAQCLTTEQCCFDDECTETGPDACLVPNCEGDGTCTYTPSDALCDETGEDGCLVGVCNSDGSCTYTPNNALCTETGEDACLVGVCDTAGTCSYTPNSELCAETGDDECLVGTCGASGTCSYSPDNALCTETGADGCLTGTCSAAGACSYSPSDALCDETGECLTGTCSAAGACSYTSDNDACDACETCTSAGACVSECNGCETCEAGECVELPLGTDPNDFCSGNQVCCRGECASPAAQICRCERDDECGFCEYCGEGFICTPQLNTDVNDECDDCRVCNGQGVCGVAPAGFECDGGICCNGTCREGVEVCPACTGAGDCAPTPADTPCWLCTAGACEARPGFSIIEGGEVIGICGSDGAGGGTGTFIPGEHACVVDADCPEGDCYTGVCASNQCVMTGCGGQNEVCCRGTCKMADADEASAEAFICPICEVDADCCSGCCHYAPCWVGCGPNGDNIPAAYNSHNGEANCQAAGNYAAMGHCHAVDRSHDTTFICSDCIPDHAACGGGGPCCNGSCEGGFCGGAFAASEPEEIMVAAEEECSPKDVCDEGECGDVDDGCGGTIECGECEDAGTGEPPAPEPEETTTTEAPVTTTEAPATTTEAPATTTAAPEEGGDSGRTRTRPGR